MAKSKAEVTYKEYVAKIDDLATNELNPRKIDRKAYDQLKKSLEDFPEMKNLRPIVIDEDNIILGGHQRIYVLKDLGYTDVLVKQVTGFTEKQKREFIIKDNTASGSWDTDIIANLWDTDELKDWGMPDFKLAGLGDDNEKSDDNKEAYKNHEVTCPHCGESFLLSDAE